MMLSSMPGAFSYDSKLPGTGDVDISTRPRTTRVLSLRSSRPPCASTWRRSSCSTSSTSPCAFAPAPCVCARAAGTSASRRRSAAVFFKRFLIVVLKGGGRPFPLQATVPRSGGGGLFARGDGARAGHGDERLAGGEVFRALREADAAGRDLARLAGGDQRVHDLRVVARVDEGLDALDGVFEAHALLVRAVGRHRVEGVGDRDDARLHRYLVALQALRVALAVHHLVVHVHAPRDEGR